MSRAFSRSALLLSVLVIAAPSWGVTLLHEFDGLTGSQPYSDVRRIGDSLYGTTTFGGLGGGGVIYRVGINGGDYQVLHDFGLDSDEGAISYGGLVFDGNTLFGTTRRTVFAIEPDGAGYRTLHRFRRGVGTEAGLTQVGTTLYGVTYNGGETDRGTVFSIESDGVGYDIVHELETGRSPLGTPVVWQDRLFATASQRGPGGWGVLFAVDLDGDNFEVLHAFDRLTGAYPGAGVAIVEGRLYGTTLMGGPSAGGVVYAIDADGSDFEILHAFSDIDGYRLGGGVTVIGDELYGSTMLGGLHGAGTLFTVKLDGSGFRTLHHFRGAPLDGESPAPLAGFAVQGAKLFGTSTGGGHMGFGSVYSFMIPEPSTALLGLAAIWGLVGLSEPRSTQPGKRLQIPAAAS